MKKLLVGIVLACMLSFGCATMQVDNTPKLLPGQECAGSHVQCRGVWYTAESEAILFIDSECDGVIDRAVYGARVDGKTMMPIQELTVEDAKAAIEKIGGGLWHDCDGNPIKPLF